MAILSRSILRIKPFLAAALSFCDINPAANQAPADSGDAAGARSEPPEKQDASGIGSRDSTAANLSVAFIRETAYTFGSGESIGKPSSGGVPRGCKAPL